MVLVVLNWLFFGAMVAGALLGQAGVVFFRWPVGEEVLTLEVGNVVFVVLGIFLFNLVLSGLVFITLPGLVFFPLSVVALVVRAALWGVLLNQVPTPLVLAVLPTLILEGEGYVLAALAGINLGLSWLKPKWMFKGENVSRLESVKRALMDAVRIYVLVALLLFVAAVVETVTILSI